MKQCGMMKKLLLPVALAALTFTTGLLALGQVHQAPPDTPSVAQQATAEDQATHPNDMQTQDAKAFSGTIMKEKGKLVLRDSVAKVSYQLDDQDKAKQFVGKQVKVTGKLDLDANLIHIDSIVLLS